MIAVCSPVFARIKKKNVFVVVDLFHLFERELRFEKCITINQYKLCPYADS